MMGPSVSNLLRILSPKEMVNFVNCFPDFIETIKLYLCVLVLGMMGCASEHKARVQLCLLSVCAELSAHSGIIPTHFI